jgi:SAM-dependent methyltransferase
MSEAVLAEHRVIWSEKPALRAIYTDFYRRILAHTVVGRTLEVGGGTGNLKEFMSDVVCTDIVSLPWLDAVADAQALPFAEQAFANIVMVDVLHHIERPARFLSEAARVLRPGGRLLFLEPAITPLSSLFYNNFHPEPVDMDADPFADAPLDPNRMPFDANQAIPTLLLGKHRNQLEQRFPNLRLAHFERLSFLAYPLSGGFRRWSLIPGLAVNSVLRFENLIAPALGAAAAFRLLAVFEHQPQSNMQAAR